MGLLTARFRERFQNSIAGGSEGSIQNHTSSSYSLVLPGSGINSKLDIDMDGYGSYD